MNQAIPAYSADRSQIGVRFYISIASVYLRLGTRFMEIKSCDVFPVGTFADLTLIPLHLGLVFFRAFQIIVDCDSVGSRHGCHIECCLHASLDLEAVDSCFDHLRNVLNHAQVAGVENIAAALIFIDRHPLARSCLLRHRIFPAARMSTGALVRVAPRQKIAEKTSS